MSSSPSRNTEEGTLVQANGLRIYQFDGIAVMMQNFMKRVSKPDHKTGGLP